jgi:signal transduction histidine kinase
MITKRLMYWLMILAGIAGMIGLTLWDVHQIRADALARDQRWVSDISEIVMARRQSVVRWIEHFPVRSATFRDIADSRPDVRAILMIDQKHHENSRWVHEGLEGNFDKLDPRLGVLQLQALDKDATLMGPLVMIKNKPYFTVVRPLDSARVLICFLDVGRIWKMLQDESELWHRRISIYDYEKNLLFQSDESIVPAPLLIDTLAKVQNKHTIGIIRLPRDRTWQWLATFHYDPALDWTFIIARRTTWVYLPVIYFLLCLVGVLLLAQIPFKAAIGARHEALSQALTSFAGRLDNYIRGKDSFMQDPPHALRSLVPIVTTVRWLMPQWKKAEAFPKELALERKLLSLLVESLPEGILFFNAQGGMQLSNELGRVFLSLEQEGREARMVSGVQVPRGFLEQYIEPVFTGAQPNLGKEVEVAWADGKHLYRLWVERVEAEAGTIGGFIVVVRDITFRKQWDYVQEQVLSGITHDLRGPLSAVLGYIDLLKRQLGEGATAKVAEYLRLAREAGMRLSQMVSDILDVVRFEQGKIELTIERIPVSEMFQRLKNTFEVLAQQKKVNLKLAILGDTGLSAAGDRKLLERVLDNLVGNAIKFTPPDGNIMVTAKVERNRVTFDVVDTGRGIPREAQSRIFDKFQQVRPGDRSAGYGLGLAVAKFIVEAHKGEIRVESEVGIGSRFSFWLPIRQPDGPSRDSLDSMDPNRIAFPPSDPRAA